MIWLVKIIVTEAKLQPNGYLRSAREKGADLKGGVERDGTRKLREKGLIGLEAPK